VLFDFGGTLDADGVHWSPRFYTAYRQAGGALDFAAFDPLFRASDAALGRLAGVTTLGFRATIEALARLLVAALPEHDRIEARELSDRFLSDAVATVRRNVPVLERLGRRYRLGLVSNFTGNLKPCLDELGLTRLFAAVSDSAVVGWAKPDRRIFEHALTALAAPVDPEEGGNAWMVGDNLDADIRGAAALGLSTCWIAPADRAAPPPGLVPTARISRLPDVEQVLA
jgi:HAD superfamily hydrolase (TIGR01549 family)